MTVLEMFSQSGILTLLGMGVVFFFLIIMILAMIALHAVVHALKWDAEPAGEQPVAAPSPSPSPSVSVPAEDSGAVVAAIAAVLKDKKAL
ncbi:OadG family protein [Treponema succinifaciens]|uniref:OadG family protein n=1 Tax=Treponema succinifaciens TaxID=167 RepID=UPI0023F3FEB9|nr:OadG family protein [Treponema succinifaciens]